MPKRLGYLAEDLGLDGADGWIEHWRSMMGTGITLLDRGGSPTGRITRLWGLKINAGASGAGR